MKAYKTDIGPGWVINDPDAEARTMLLNAIEANKDKIPPPMRSLSAVVKHILIPNLSKILQ